MDRNIELLLSEIERKYYDGARAEALNAKVLEVVKILLSLPADDPIRALCKNNAQTLWGAAEGDADLSIELVRDALNGSEGPVYLRAWANFWQILALNRNVA
jgi:hypothetical protein